MDNIYQKELHEKAKNAYNNMGNEEIAESALEERKCIKIIGLLIGAVLLLTSIALGLQPLIGNNGDELGLFIALAVFYCICGIISCIITFMLLKKSDEVLVINKIKRGLRKEMEEDEENERKEKHFSDFSISKEIDITVDGKSTIKLLVDDVRKQFIYQHNTSFSKTYDFCDLINYEVYENNKKTIQGRAGSALVGGVLFGAGGAIVGGSRQRVINEACTQLKLIIRLNDLERPQIVIDYQIADKNVNLLVRYRMRENLQMVCSVLEYILNAKNISENDSASQKEVSTNKSSKEQLQELKEMLDDGLITQEDFEQKKKQILGL